MESSYTCTQVFSDDKEVIIGYCPMPKYILEFVDECIEAKMASLPKDAQILIKPNFHKDLPSILGNTTDFRLIIAIVRSLQKRGYKKIIIGEGPACGFDYSGVDVFKRLRVNNLANYLGVEYLDFNRADAIAVELCNGRTARIAKIVSECDYFINVPKLKTHLLAQISAALKSLVGCFVGVQKRELHYKLLENIIRVNTIFPPDLIFIDALVAMEGQGPGIGTPVVLDRVLFGKNAFTLDLACTVLSGHDPEELKLIRLAVEKGFLTQSDVNEAHIKIPCVHQFIPSKPSKLILFLSLPFINKIKNFVRFIYTRPFINHILYRFKLAEDVMNFNDGDFKIQLPKLPDERDRIRCTKYCPLSIDIKKYNWPEDSYKKCLECMYCVFLSGDKGSKIVGNPGYLEYLLYRYKPWTTKLE